MKAVPDAPQARHCAPQKKKRRIGHCVHCEKTIVPIVVKKTGAEGTLYPAKKHMNMPLTIPSLSR